MAEPTTAPPPRRLVRPDPWSVASVLIAAMVLMPVAAVVWLAFNPVENIWPHMMATTLPRYLSNTGILMAGVGVLTAAVGAGAAWLVAMYRFPGARILEIALLLPLAVPAYIGAYALVDLFEFAGPVQTALRGWMGWVTPRDYWFPAVRSRGSAILVLSSAYYPYVYLLARAAFREQSGNAYEVARALGTGPWGMFLRIGLPLARPAIAAGVALACMETVNDFGAVSYFGVQTLTTGIFSVWLTAGNAGGAAQLSLVSLGVILALMGVERAGRRNLRFHRAARQSRPIMPRRLLGWRGWLATALCALPFAAGFVLPVAVIAHHALSKPEHWLTPGLGRALGHTMVTGGLASVLCVGAALVVVYGARLSRRRLPQLMLPLTGIGYAAPGAVLAVGLLIPMAALDHRMADAVQWLTGRDPGLLLTGSASLIVLAYVVRFFAIAQGATDSAMDRIAPSLPLAARSLGRTSGGVLRAVHLPLMRGSVGVALLVVFVDCVKELPATLLLRPFNYDTLATRVHERASVEALAEASPAALLVIAVSLIAVGLLARSAREAGGTRG
ncbi:iron(III) transport system permease protein [Gemmobacter megaterium]|uniref:Iron(III) transport system permease protein n=1 Tax=Gemmobacter megaterium TaxID=1086013 RepID=A0A1N7KJK1_9RHOB|nr:iron ABC transporter permease [Gemmobacter megaterium]GGE02503.1 iron ABC transporter permease [Gemmobacter megaterium]SIS61763.1 iron(III) transport system permease protein [Gemmobacter megaterium]